MGLIQSKTDRISGLPLHIIHDHILTSLPYKHVQKLSSLSKTWHHIIASYPYLVFDDSDFRRNQYLDHVTETLQRFDRCNDPKLRLRKLTIPFNRTFDSIVAPVLDSWIKLALRRGVEEFNIQICDPYRDASTPPYDLPQALFDEKSSIKVAKFQGYCSFLKTFHNDAMLGRRNTNLIKLCLDNVPLDEKTLSLIISTFPLMEELTMSSCLGLDCFRICNLQKLQTLRFFLGKRTGNNYTIDVNAPSLQILEIRGRVKIGNFECPKLTHLDLHSVTELYSQDILSRLPLIQSLRLAHILPSITKLKISSYTLIELKVFGCHQFLNLEIDAPNLISAIYKGDLSPLSLLPHYVKGQWDVYSASNNKRVEDHLVELSNFGSKVNHIKYLKLFVTEDYQPFSFEELNMRVVQPVANIDHLDLCVFCTPKAVYPDLLDGLLSTCHPRSLSLILGFSYSYQDFDSYKTNNQNVMKHILKIIVSRHCCSCTLARSWLHHLEDVTYVTEDGSEGKLPMWEKLLPNKCMEIKFMYGEISLRWQFFCSASLLTCV